MTLKPIQLKYDGRIRRKNVKILPSDADIVELLPLMLDENYHQMPILDNQGRHSEMVFENQVIKAVFNQLVTR